MFMVLNYALRNLPALVADHMLPSRNSSVCPVSKSLGVTLLSPFSLTGSSSSTAWVSMPSASSPIALPSSGNDKTKVAESLLSWWCHTNNLRPVTTYKAEPHNGSSNQCPRIVFMPFFLWIQAAQNTPKPLCILPFCIFCCSEFCLLEFRCFQKLSQLWLSSTVCLLSQQPE